MHGIHSALAIKRQRKTRDNQRKARERRYSVQSTESGDTHSPHGSTRRKLHPHKVHTADNNNLLDTKVSKRQTSANTSVIATFLRFFTTSFSLSFYHSQVVSSIGMLHIGVVFLVFGIFLLGAGFFPDNLSNQPSQTWHLLGKWLRMSTLLSQTIVC